MTPGAELARATRQRLTRAVTFALWIRWGRQLVAPLERWPLAERPATGDEQDLALRLPARVTKVSMRIWGAAAVVFPVLSATYSAELAGSRAARR